MIKRISFIFVISVIFLCGCQKDALPPEVTTDELSDITANSAVCGGDIKSSGSAKVLESGLCWSTDHPPTIADSRTKDGPESGSFSAQLVGLSSPATYFVRAYATNRHGTGYGEIRTFTTPYTGEIVTDYDGNIYHTVTIGTQVWMLENLKVTHFRNGLPIALQSDSASWYGNSYLPGYCYYDNDSAMITRYG